MKRTVALIGLVLALFFSLFLPAAGEIKLPPPPQTDIYVQDYAEMLTPEEEEEVLRLGSALEEKTGAQVVLVTIPSLEGQEIFDYAQSLFRAWGIGQKEENNGVLILAVRDNIEQNRRGRIRIHVGYGLEGALPDGKVGRILDEMALPAFARGEYGEGLTATYRAVVKEVAAEYGVDIAALPGETPGGREQTGVVVLSGWKALLFTAGVVLFLLVDFFFFGGAMTWFIISLLSAGRFRGGGGFGGGGFGGGGFGGGFGGGDSGGGGAER
ncbi:MAG: uncharacterized protein PWQ31_81 [Eubacteriales bacterium]|nr:uncharacterized protein [Eubacteriales bacterium]